MAGKVVKKVAYVEQRQSKVKLFFLGLLMLLLNVVGFAFLVQGFSIQLSTGILYQGMVHYLVGFVLLMLGWSIKRR